MFEYLKNLVKRQPVRTAVYPLALFALGLLVKEGVIDDTVSGLVAAALAAGLGVSTEAARSVVTPVHKMRREQHLS